MKISVNHSLQLEEAKRRVLKLADKLKQQYGSQISNYSETWSGNTAKITLKAMGINISGDLNISSSDVSLNGKLPLIARPYKSKLETMVRTELTNLLR